MVDWLAVLESRMDVVTVGNLVGRKAAWLVACLALKLVETTVDVMVVKTG